MRKDIAAILVVSAIVASPFAALPAAPAPAAGPAPSPRIIVLPPANDLENLVAQRGSRPYATDFTEPCRLAQGSAAVWVVWALARLDAAMFIRVRSADRPEADTSMAVKKSIVDTSWSEGG